MVRCAAVLTLLAGCATSGGAGPPLGGDAPGPPADRRRGEARRRPVNVVEPQPLAVSDELPPYDSRELPGGLACLIRLRELEIPHRHLKRLRGVDTPVQVTGEVGGIRYRAMGRLPLVADCRLVLALHRAAPYLRSLGVGELHFSSAYSYRMMASGRPSRHAMGLAIDVHRVRAHGELLDVARDYELGFDDGGGCAINASTLNRMGCLLQQRGLFDRVLTPDFDRAHYNHFHLAILSLHRRRRAPRPRPDAD
jgi:hypothetical protein